MSRRIIGYLALAVIAGCYYDFEYRYVSLVRSMNVLDYGPPEVLNIRNHSDMPISYVREGESYILFATIDAKANRPTVIFSATDANGKDIYLEATSDQCHFYPKALAPWEIERHDYPANGVRIVFSGENPEICQEVDDATAHERTIQIAVFDEDRRLIEEDEVSFDIVRNGIKRVYEGIL